MSVSHSDYLPACLLQFLAYQNLYSFFTKSQKSKQDTFGYCCHLLEGDAYADVDVAIIDVDVVDALLMEELRRCSLWRPWAINRLTFYLIFVLISFYNKFTLWFICSLNWIYLYCFFFAKKKNHDSNRSSDLSNDLMLLNPTKFKVHQIHKYHWKRKEAIRQETNPFEQINTGLMAAASASAAPAHADWLRRLNFKD